MKVQLLPSSIETGIAISQRQHLSTIIVDDRVAFDAGSLALSCSDAQRNSVRDVVLSHDHLDHIAGLPLFIDDLFDVMSQPVRVHATAEMIEILERDIFNWSIYPKFSELKNRHGAVLRYEQVEAGRRFDVQHLTVSPIAVNHNVRSLGFVVTDGSSSFGLTGDTASTEEIWEVLNDRDDLTAVLVECAFPNGLSELASASHHMTPERLAAELLKFTRTDVPVYVVNIKPTYRETVLAELSEVSISNLNILEIGKVYEF